MSEGGFRYFLPAFLVADIRDALQTADPVFHLTHGFVDIAITHEIGGRAFTRRSGRSQFINPRRYGATTFLDYARCRLSVFSREESAAIVTYLEFIRGLEARATDREPIDRALEQFWRDRAASAPTAVGPAPLPGRAGRVRRRADSPAERRAMTEIRLAREADGAALAEIYRPAVSERATSFEVDPPDAAEMARRVSSLLATHPWLVCVEDGQHTRLRIRQQAP